MCSLTSSQIAILSLLHQYNCDKKQLVYLLLIRQILYAKSSCYRSIADCQRLGLIDANFKVTDLGLTSLQNYVG